MSVSPATTPQPSLPWLYRTRIRTVVAVITGALMASSMAMCFSTYLLLGIPIADHDSVGLVMILAPLLTPLLVAPFTLVPIIRAGRRIAVLLDEVDDTRRRLEAEVGARRLLQAELEDQAGHDALTGLLNRRGFFQAVGEGTDRDGVIVTVDVNGLKPINDTWGHATGDLVLRAVADALRDAAGDDACVARLGGDEFVALIDGPDGGRSEAVQARLEDLRVVRPDRSVAPVSAAVGVAQVNGRESIDAALIAADQRMYAAKRRGASRAAA